MLPLDTLTDQAAKAFRDNGVSPDDITICVQLDLDVNGDFGESWLALTKDKLYCLSANTSQFVRKSATKAVSSKKKGKTDDSEPELLMFSGKYIFQTYELEKVTDPYVDSFVSSNRFFIKYDTQSLGIVFSTNAKKQKLFAFLEIMNRVKDGREVKQDDPLFDQFNVRCPKCGEFYSNQERKICMHCMDKNVLVKRLFSYFKGYGMYLGVVFVCMIITSVIALINPLLYGEILYDKVLDMRESNTSWLQGRIDLFVILLFAMSAFSIIIGIVQGRSIITMTTRVAQKMKTDIFSAMQRLSLSFFNNNQTGRLISRVNTDADVIRNFYSGFIPHLFLNVVIFLSVTIFLFIINWKLTLIIFIPVPIIVWIFRSMLPKLWRLYTKNWRRSSALNSMLGDSLNGIRVVKAFAKESDEAHRFQGYSERLFRTGLDINLTRLSIFPVVSLLIGITSNVIRGFGGFDVMIGGMSFGTFMSYLGYTGMIFAPLQLFSDAINQFSEIANSAQRMFEVLDTKPEIIDSDKSVLLDRLEGKIEFKDVSFHYSPNRPILKNMSFKINKGDYIGLVGHTGAGKSTIANLITRLYDVKSGNISIDGHNIKDIEISSLRKNIAIVSQEIFLFRGTIADNIRYARPEATIEDVLNAAKAANAHDFIVNLPDGYETIVGAGSRSLSGGEQQRISIARALLLDPSILILDEATAAMDTETERLIQDALNILVKGRTTIVIAHRLSTLRECNYLFAIENGEIAEEGTHTQLLAKKGIYHRMYTLQSEAMKRVIQGQ
ncbi:MAG: ABC transporter ATP-binding protein [Eubacteriales bacterium]